MCSQADKCSRQSASRVLNETYRLENPQGMRIFFLRQIVSLLWVLEVREGPLIEASMLIQRLSQSDTRTIIEEWRRQLKHQAKKYRTGQRTLLRGTAQHSKSCLKNKHVWRWSWMGLGDFVLCPWQDYWSERWVKRCSWRGAGEISTGPPSPKCIEGTTS